LAIARVRARVSQGGHDIKDEVIRRRFEAGFRNFKQIYRALVGTWVLYNAEDKKPNLIATGANR